LPSIDYSSPNRNEDFSINFTLQKGDYLIDVGLEANSYYLVYDYYTAENVTGGMPIGILLPSSSLSSVIVTGSSEMIRFAVGASEPFPVVPVAAASGASLAIVGVGLLVYFKKRNH
jgi:hypothetical protein